MKQRLLSIKDCCCPIHRLELFPGSGYSGKDFISLSWCLYVVPGNKPVECEKWKMVCITPGVSVSKSLSHAGWKCIVCPWKSPVNSGIGLGTLRLSMISLRLICVADASVIPFPPYPPGLPPHGSGRVYVHTKLPWCLNHCAI